MRGRYETIIKKSSKIGVLSSILLLFTSAAVPTYASQTGITLSELDEKDVARTCGATSGSDVKISSEDLQIHSVSLSDVRDEIVVDFHEFTQINPNFFFQKVGIEHNLFLEGLNTPESYEKFHHTILGSGVYNPPFKGARWIEKIIEEAEAEESDVTYEVIQIVRSESDQKNSSIEGAFLLGWSLNAENSILISDFVTSDSIDELRPYILDKLLKSYPHAIPSHYTYLYSLRFNELNPQAWQSEFNLYCSNHFMVQELYVNADDGETSMVEVFEYFKNYQRLYRDKPLLACTFQRLPR